MNFVKKKAESNSSLINNQGSNITLINDFLQLKEINPTIKIDEEKRDLNKLKHEIKNNLFFNYTKEEEEKKK